MKSPKVITRGHDTRRPLIYVIATVTVLLLAGYLGYEIGLNRARSRSNDQLDRMEREAIDLFRAVREGYLQLAKSEPDRFLVLDGSQSIETLQDSIWETVKRLSIK